MIGVWFFGLSAPSPAPSPLFEDLVLGSVLFSLVITGTVKAVGSQMRKFAGVTVLQDRKEGRRE